MSGRAVELTVAGTSCRVVSTASEEQLAELASMVEEKLARILKPGRPVSAQAMLLAAIALAHDATEARARADAVADRARSTLAGLLEKVDALLAASEEAAADPKAKPGSHARAAEAAMAAAERASRLESAPVIDTPRPAPSDPGDRPAAMTLEPATRSGRSRGRELHRKADEGGE